MFSSALNKFSSCLRINKDKCLHFPIKIRYSVRNIIIVLYVNPFGDENILNAYLKK